MNRVSTLIIGALFAIAAVEFRLLGASAAGLTGGNGGGLPPIGERFGVDSTATGTATFTVTPTAPLTPIDPRSPPQLSPPSVDATGIDIRANPLTIECNGYDRSTVTVRIYDANGNPVPDGTWVYFSTYNGYADPWQATTVNGYAETQITFYGDIFPYGPNVTIESGLLQAGIRIRCNPQSNPCLEPWPESPPPSPGCEEPPPPSTPDPCNPSPSGETLSPHCDTTPSPTPYPCNPSPGSGQLSPPCEPEPPCADSPPSVSPPCNVSPPTGPVVTRTRVVTTRTPVVTRTPVPTSTRVVRTATVAATRTATRGNRCADVNDDGTVTGSDIRAIVRSVNSGAYSATYDINRDGKLGSSDVFAGMRQLGRSC